MSVRKVQLVCPEDGASVSMDETGDYGYGGDYVYRMRLSCDRCGLEFESDGTAYIHEKEENNNEA